ncbi:MAG TPA: FAD-dependent oxidoreductase [Blastocatellia bacterium]|nr:FAD-dependent oxidoreductase [Blastocatellia bacterium]
MSEDSNRVIKGDVAVIGGGLAGLTCGIGLRNSGLKVIMLERNEMLGGRARGWIDTETGDPVDIGPHIFLSEYPNTLKLLDILGTRENIAWQTDQFITMVKGRHRIKIKMAPLPPPFHFVPSVFADSTIPHRDKLSNLSVTWRAMQIDEEEVLQLDAINAYDFLRNAGVSEQYINTFWAFVSMSIMNVPVDQCSAGALMRFYRHLIGHNKYYIGFPKSGLDNIFAVRAREVLEASGVQFLMNTTASGFVADMNSITRLETTAGLGIEAKMYVSTLAPQDLRQIARSEWLDRHSVFANLESFLPCPYISSYIWFDRKLTREQFWARAYSPVDLNCDFYDLTNINHGLRDRPSIIASNIIYSHRANNLSDVEIISATVRELEEFLPEVSTAKVLHKVVNRIPMAIHCPHPGTERKRPETHTPLDNLFLAGDWTQTCIPPSMESAVRSGWLAAERVLERAGNPQNLAVQVKETEGIAGLVRRIGKWLA